MEQETKKINRSIKIYPIFASFTGDLIFFVPIDTLFLTLVKGLNASQITAMTMVALIICIVFQKVILAIVKKDRKCKFIKIRSNYVVNCIISINIWKIVYCNVII